MLDPAVIFPQSQATIRTARFIVLISMHCHEESKFCIVVNGNTREVLDRIGIEFIFRVHGEAKGTG